MTRPRLDLTRSQILAFRRHVGALDERLPPGRRSLRRAAWAGLQDSMPRAALLSIHARVEGTEPSTWEDDRELLVADADRRRALWTSRVGPGALLVEGEIVGTWRRAHETVTIQTWRRLTRAARDGVVGEAASLPLPGVEGGSSSAGTTDASCSSRRAIAIGR